jgi:hypothetical protein
MMLLKIAAHELERIIAHCLPLFALVLSPLPLALVLDALVFSPLPLLPLGDCEEKIGLQMRACRNVQL